MAEGNNGDCPQDITAGCSYSMHGNFCGNHISVERIITEGSKMHLKHKTEICLRTFLEIYVNNAMVLSVFAQAVFALNKIGEELYVEPYKEGVSVFDRMLLRYF